MQVLSLLSLLISTHFALGAATKSNSFADVTSIILPAAFSGSKSAAYFDLEPALAPSCIKAFTKAWGGVNLFAKDEAPMCSPSHGVFSGAERIMNIDCNAATGNCLCTIGECNSAGMKDGSAHWKVVKWEEKSKLKSNNSNYQHSLTALIGVKVYQIGEKDSILTATELYVHASNSKAKTTKQNKGLLSLFSLR